MNSSNCGRSCLLLQTITQPSLLGCWRGQHSPAALLAGAACQCSDPFRVPKRAAGPASPHIPHVGSASPRQQWCTSKSHGWVLTSTCWVGAGVLLPVLLSTREGRRKNNLGFMALHHNLYRIRGPTSCSGLTLPSTHQLPDGTRMGHCSHCQGLQFSPTAGNTSKTCCRRSEGGRDASHLGQSCPQYTELWAGISSCCCSPNEGGCLL